jgi:DNA-binding MarR family transcriptional regulator
MHRHSAHLARALSVRPVDAVALQHLWRRPLTPTELGERLGSGSGSLTGIIDRLEAHGLVARQPHPSDRRSITIEITPEGWSRTREQIDAFTSRVAHAAVRLSPDDRRVVGTFLRSLTEIAEVHTPGVVTSDV